MEVYLNSIDGISDAIISMYMSKRTLTPELMGRIIALTEEFTDRKGIYIPRKYDEELTPEREEFIDMMTKVFKWGTKHITMLRFIDLSFTVFGLHRAGQDDWDAHACRFNNRIIRSSTRLATFGDAEISDYYKDKIITTDQFLKYTNYDLPETTIIDGVEYVKSVNGYIRADLKNDKDVKRGLYMLSIPSNFIFRVNLTEWAHVYKERNGKSGANPEVKMLCESIANILETTNPFFTRELFDNIKN